MAHPFKRIATVPALVAFLKENNPENDPKDFFIALTGGLLRSSKSIQLQRGGKFSVVNEIDDTEQILTAPEFYSHSNIGTAMNYGNFYAYNND